MKSILITGGAGYFGRHFTRHLLQNNMCDRICIYSRNEHAHAEFRSELNDDERCRWFIGDVRKKERLIEAMEGCDIVVHAAALKRVETGEYNWDEFAETNIDGSRNVTAAAKQAGVSKAILISSDKAVESINRYGRTKAAAEDAFLSANQKYGGHGPRYAVCRYGNVFGSTSSVVPKWRQEIANGSTSIEVRDRRCTRFFMRASEAVELVMHAIDAMKGGETIFPRTLPAYCLGDLADLFSEAYGVAQRETFLPAYEKLHESLEPGLSSEFARRMSKDELRHELGLLPELRVAA